MTDTAVMLGIISARPALRTTTALTEFFRIPEEKAQEVLDLFYYIKELPTEPQHAFMPPIYRILKEEG